MVVGQIVVLQPCYVLFHPSVFILFHCFANSLFYANLSLLNGALHALDTCRKTNTGGGGTDVTQSYKLRWKCWCVDIKGGCKQVQQKQ